MVSYQTNLDFSVDDHVHNNSFFFNDIYEAAAKLMSYA